MSKQEKAKPFVCPTHGIPLVKTRLRAIMHKPQLMEAKVCPKCGYLALFLTRGSITDVIDGHQITSTVSFG